MLFFYSTQTVSTSQTPELHFLKNRVGRSIFLFYTSGEFLAKIFENNPFKFVTNNGKGFSIDVVSRTWFIVLLYNSLNYSV